jgi:hypothetical protein
MITITKTEISTGSTEITYPALFKDMDSELVVLAFDNNKGIVIKTSPKMKEYKEGDFSEDWCSFKDRFARWEMIRGETKIEMVIKS